MNLFHFLFFLCSFISPPYISPLSSNSPSPCFLHCPHPRSMTPHPSQNASHFLLQFSFSKNLFKRHVVRALKIKVHLLRRAPARADLIGDILNETFCSSSRAAGLGWKVFAIFDTDCMDGTWWTGFGKRWGANNPEVITTPAVSIAIVRQTV